MDRVLELLLTWSFDIFQLSSVAQSGPTLCDPMNRSTPASLSNTKSRSLPKLMSIESVMPSNHLILCHPLLPLPSIFPSIRVFSNESALRIRWSKYWSFSFNISPSDEHSGLISFTTDWLVGSPCSPRDSQESSPTPQFKSINSSALIPTRHWSLWDQLTTTLVLFLHEKVQLLELFSK